MAPIKLYWTENSIPSIAAHLAAKALDIDFRLVRLDLNNEENLTEEFIKMNPQHCIPTIDDDGFYLWESAAIMTYLARAHCSNNDVYPTDAKKRAVVDRFLSYYQCTAITAISDWLYPPLYYGGTLEKKNEDKVRQWLSQMNDLFLADGRDWLAGDHVTLGDLAILPCVLHLMIPKLALTEWPRVAAWLERCKTLPYFKECADPFFDWVAKANIKL